MSSPPPLVSVAPSDGHGQYLAHLHQQHLPDVCVPVSVGVTQAHNLSQTPVSGLCLRQAPVSHQAMILSPAVSPTRIESYNIPHLTGNTIQHVDTISTKQLTNTQF